MEKSYNDLSDIQKEMTNDRSYGWDFDGNELNSKEVEKIYPIYAWFEPLNGDSDE